MYFTFVLPKSFADLWSIGDCNTKIVM